MTQQLADKIISAWDHMTDEDDSILTEQLLARLAEECNCSQEEIIETMFTET